MQGGAKTDLGNLGEKHIEMNRNRRRKSLSRQELNRAPRLQEGLPSATWKKNPNQSRCFPVRSERVSEAVTSPLFLCVCTMPLLKLCPLLPPG